MKAELQHKEPQQAESIQSKRERSKLSFVDNRPQVSIQAKLVKLIQKKENETKFSYIDDAGQCQSNFFVSKNSIIQRDPDDAEIRDRIKSKYEISIDDSIGGELLQEIDRTLSALPAFAVSHDKLTDITRGGLGQASYYDYNDQSIHIKNPFGLPDSVYIRLNKESSWQRWLMDQGAIVGLPSMLDPDNSSTLRNLMSLAKGVGLVLGDVFRMFPGISQRHIMGGISTANSEEKLISWTLRHEIGHSVDKSIGWSDRKLFEQNQFGGWIEYRGKDDVWDAFNENRLTVSDDSYKKEKKKFDKNIENYSFTFDDGGSVKNSKRTFMRDEYGKWYSYLTKARDNAVSNYQFSSPEEWFAEAFAAYYNPKEKAASRNRLTSSVCHFFYRKIGPWRKKCKKK